MGFSLTKLPELKGHMDAAETALIIDEVNAGNGQARALFKEAMLHTDMPLSFTSLTNRSLVPEYAQATPQHGEFTRPVTLSDLREQNYLEVFPDLSSLPERPGGKPRKGVTAPRIGPNNEYPAITLDEDSTKLRIDKYGLRLPLTIEMIINDQLGVLSNYPAALAVFIRQVEDVVVAEALIADDGDGARASITHVTGDPVLSQDSLTDAINQLNQIKVHGSRALLGSRPVLVIPRSLEILAQRITSLPRYDFTDTTVTPNRTYKDVANPAFGMKTVVLDALDLVNGSTSANQTWFIMADGAQLSGRPGVAFSRLQGHEEPETFIASPNALTPAGGLANWRDGSFTNDSIEFKVRHWVGAKIVFGEGILVSEPTA